MSLLLQPATSSDLPEIVRLMNAAYRGSGPGASWNTEATFLDGERTNEPALQAELATKPEAFLVARQEPQGPLRGSVWLEPLSDGLWYLGSLTVDPFLQNAGLGRKLLTAAESWASARGAARIEIHVINVRDTLIAWYERRGYRLTGETHPFPYGDTRFGVPRRDDLTFLVLEKSLQTSATPAG